MALLPSLCPTLSPVGTRKTWLPWTQRVERGRGWSCDPSVSHCGPGGGRGHRATWSRQPLPLTQRFPQAVEKAHGGGAKSVHSPSA